jgi:pimeloyl-ACP methyl ester carboxylesterase
MSYRDPQKFRIDPSKLTEQQRAGIAANRATLRMYGGAQMADSSLLGRLSSIRIPTLVVWGAADRMIPLGHGEAYASGIPNAHLEVIEEAGHLPQLEAPDRLLGLVKKFATAA